MDRYMEDENFIRRALDLEDCNKDKMIVTQSLFNYKDSKEIDIQIHSALIAAVFIYVESEKLPEESIEEIYKISNLGQARSFVDKYAKLTYKEDAQ